MSFIIVVHLIVSILLIILVLVQDTKSGTAGAFGGAGSNSVLGPTGATTLVAKVTWGVAIIFAITSITLASKTSSKSESVLDTLPVTQQPATTPEAPAATAPAETSAAYPEVAPAPTEVKK